MKLPKLHNNTVLVFFILLYLCCHKVDQCIGQQQTSTTPGDIITYSNVSCIAHDTKFSCDCRNANGYMTLPRLFGYVYQIEISNCKHMTIQARSLEATNGLRTVIFKNIEILVLDQNALSFPIFTSNTPLIVEFKQVTIEVIEPHAINGNIGEVTFVDSFIRNIKPFALTTLKDRAMFFKMERVKVHTMEQQALKKFVIDQFEIVDSEFLSDLPSKAFYELDVTSSLRIQNVTFKKVHTNAFSFRGVKKLSVIDNKFDQTESVWITARIHENALIKGNTFGITSPIAFREITMSNDVVFTDRVELQFINNSIQFLNEPRPLIFNDKIQLHITRLQYRNNFPCKDLEMDQPKTPFFKSYADSIYFETKSNSQSLVLSQIIDVDCKEKSYLLYIILGVIGVLLILIVIAAIIIAYIINKRKKRKLNVVMPESRTYKETQIIYQIENAGLLKTDL